LNDDARELRERKIQERGRAFIALVEPHLPREFGVGPGADLWPPIATALLSRMTTTLRYLLELHLARLEADGATLARSLYEHAVHFAWLAAEPSPARVEGWQREDLCQRLAAYNDMAAHGVEMIDDAGVAALKAKIESMHGARLKLEQLAIEADGHWAEKVLKEMGEHTELMSFRGWYALLYRMSSTMAHPSQIGLHRVTEDVRRARIRVQLEEPSPTRQGPYGMTTYVYGVALLVAAGTLGWPDRNEVLAIGRLE